MKLFVLFDESGDHIYSEMMEKSDINGFQKRCRKALEQYRQDNDLPTNAIRVNFVASLDDDYKRDEWGYYSFITGKFYDSRKKAEEEEEI